MTVILRITVPIVVMLAAGCAPSPPPAATDDGPRRVAVGRAELRELASPVEAGGIVRARRTAVIASRVLTPVIQVHVNAGDRVRRGAPLVTLDGRELRANTVRAAADLAAAEEAARAAAADTRAAESALHLARSTFERVGGLHAKRSATAQELDQATASLNAAEAQLEGARSRAAAAAASRDAGRAFVEATEVANTYAVLSAPFDGIVAERMVDPGSMAVPGAPLLTIEDPAGYRLEVHLDEARLGLVSVGQTVNVRVDGSGETWSAGRVSELSRVDSASHSFVVKIDLANAPFRSGLFGRARFAGRAQSKLAVDARTLLRRGQLTFVFVVDAEGRARLRPVSLGMVADGHAEVLAGLENGTAVVVDPPAGLADGDHVSPGPSARASRLVGGR